MFHDRASAQSPQTHSRNKKLHARNAPEIVQAHDQLHGQLIGRTCSGVATSDAKISINLIGALFGMSLVMVGIEGSHAKVLTRTERCSSLSRQLDEALDTHATAKQVTAAKAFQRKGKRVCADKKQAQGIRMLANALKLLGVTPIDPVQ